MEARAPASSIPVPRRHAASRVILSGLLVLSLSAVACSSSNVARSPVSGATTDGEREGKGRARPDRERNRPKRGDQPSGQVTTAALPGERQDPSQAPPDPSGPVVARSRAADPIGDPQIQGDTPRFIDLRHAEIVGFEQEALFRATFGDAIPRRMPDQNTFLRVGFRLQGEDRDIAIGASADDRGWKADVNAAAEFPGSLHIQGRVLIISLRWEDIGGRGGFLWQATMSWSRASAEGTDYGFDSAPDEKQQRYEE